MVALSRRVGAQRVTHPDSQAAPLIMLMLFFPTYRHAGIPRQRGDRRAFGRRCDRAPWSIHRRASSTGMAHAMRSTSAMDGAASRSGCSTFCIGVQRYRNASGSMRTRNGSRGRYHPSCSARTSVMRLGLRGDRTRLASAADDRHGFDLDQQIGHDQGWGGDRSDADIIQ